MSSSSITIRIYPVPKKPGFFDSFMDGRRITQSRTPFYSSARALLKQGCDPDALLMMHHAESEKPAMIGIVGQVAGYTVIENRKSGPRVARYQEFPAQPFWGPCTQSSEAAAPQAEAEAA